MRINFLLLVLAVSEIFASLCAAQTNRLTIESDGFVADFYPATITPKGVGILFLGGAEGGRPDGHLPKFFATNGYDVLAVAYFKEQGLPETLQMIPLEYFDKPIAWLVKNEKAPPGGLVVFGSSKGAELALLLASGKSEIRGVIALAPSSVVWDGMPKVWWPPNPQSSWSLGGKPVSFVPYDNSKASGAADPLAIFNMYKQSLTHKEALGLAAIPVEKIHGPILLLSGEDDQLWPSQQMADAICERLKEKNFQI